MRKLIKYLVIISPLISFSLKAYSNNIACYELPAAEAADIILGASHAITALGLNPKDMSIISACKRETRAHENHSSYTETDTYVFELNTSVNNFINLIITRTTRCGNTIRVTYSASLDKKRTRDY